MYQLLSAVVPGRVVGDVEVESNVAETSCDRRLAAAEAGAPFAVANLDLALAGTVADAPGAVCPVVSA